MIGTFHWVFPVMFNLFRRSRSRIWYLWYTAPDGIRKHISCRTTDRCEAKRFARAFLIGAAQPAMIASTPTDPLVTPTLETRTPPIPIEQPSLLISEFADRYVEVMSGTLTVKTISTIRDSFRSLIRFVGDMLLDELTVEECERFVQTAHPSVYTARTRYGHLRSAFEKGRRWGRLKGNPFLGVEKPKARETQMSYFTAAEFESLIRTMPKETFGQRRLVNMSILAFETGLRLGEVRHLRIEAIDRNARILNVVNTSDFTTKSKRHRSIPLTRRVLNAIDEQLSLISGHRNRRVRETIYLFPNERGLPLSEAGIGNPFVKACTATFGDRRGRSFHSLRHSFASRLGLAGIPVQMIQKLMGHQSVGVTERYLHWDRLDYSPALQVLENCASIRTTDAGCQNEHGDEC